MNSSYAVNNLAQNIYTDYQNYISNEYYGKDYIDLGKEDRKNVLEKAYSHYVQNHMMNAEEDPNNYDVGLFLITHIKMWINYGSKILFDHIYDALNEREQNLVADYVSDVLHPDWCIVESDSHTQVEVNQTGTGVRDPNTAKYYKIYYNKERAARYPSVNLPATGTGRNTCLQTVHRLVAKAFVPNPDPSYEVNHINGIRECNWYRNLEWVSHLENIRHSVRTGLFKPPRKFNVNQVRRVCEILSDPHKISWSYNMISDETGVSHATISDIANRNTWTEISKDYDILKRDLNYSGMNSPSAKFTEAQLRHVCEILSDPKKVNMTFEAISNETGVSRSVVQDIYRRTSWGYISRLYNFPPRDSYAHLKEFDSPNAKYTEDQIKSVCEIFADPNKRDWKFTKISEETGLPEYLIGRIFRREAWPEASKPYVFLSRDTYRNSRLNSYTKEQVVQACNLLDDVYNGKSSMSHKQISEQIGTSVQFVDKIAKGDVHRDVAQHYNFYKSKFGHN